MHNAYLNTYSFTKDGKKIILAPSQLPTRSSTKSPARFNLFLTFGDPHLKAFPLKSEAFKHSEPTPPKHPRPQAKKAKEVQEASTEWILLKFEAKFFLIRGE